MWKQRVNSVLRATTGYQLHRPPDPAEVAAAEKAAERAAAEQAAAERQARRARKAAAKQQREAKKAAAKPPPNPQFDEPARRIITQVRPRTMTADVKLFGLIAAARYVVQHDIPGDIVECGVWRGGSMQAAALALAEAGDTTRQLHLFDTFEGMPPPGEQDLRYDGTSAEQLLAEHTQDRPVWARAGLDDVKLGMAEVPYPADHIHYHQGMVEETVPGGAPDTIAVLRLDTDWYESTKHELEHLYPRLSPGGVLIIDDYAYWQGSREATEEWLKATGEPLLLLPSASGRIAVKPYGPRRP